MTREEQIEQIESLKKFVIGSLMEQAAGADIAAMDSGLPEPFRVGPVMRDVAAMAEDAFNQWLLSNLSHESTERLAKLELPDHLAKAAQQLVEWEKAHPGQELAPGHEKIKEALVAMGIVEEREKN